MKILGKGKRSAQTIWVNCPPSEVYAFLTDFEKNYVGWHEGVKHVRLVAGKPGHEGARYEVISESGGQERSGYFQITEARPNQQFAFSPEIEGFGSAVCQFSLEEEKGGTQIVLVVAFEVKGALRFGMAFGGKRILAMVGRRMLQGIEEALS